MLLTRLEPQHAGSDSIWGKEDNIEVEDFLCVTLTSYLGIAVVRGKLRMARPGQGDRRASSRRAQGERGGDGFRPSVEADSDFL